MPLLALQPCSSSQFSHQLLPSEAGGLVTYESDNVARLATLLLPPPEGQYRCLTIDPPWPIQKIQRFESPNQRRDLGYPTISAGQW